MDHFPQLTMSHLIVVASGLLAYVLASRLAARRQSDVHLLPKPSNAHWLWGHEKLAWESVNSQFQVDAVNELGHIVALKGALFHPDVLLVADPKALHHIFTTRCYEYPKGPLMRALAARLVGKGLVWAEGPQHKRQRQMMSPAFTHDQIRASEEDIWRITNRMIEKLRDHLARTEDTTVNIFDYISRATLDVIGIVGFGHDFQHGESPEVQEISQICAKTVETGLGPFGFIGPIILRTFPWLLKLPLKVIETQGEVKRIVQEVARRIIRDRETAQEKSGKDLLSVLLRLQDSDVDLDHLLDQAASFLFAGNETTSGSISFTCFELARHPDVQARLRKELREFKGLGPGGEPTYNELQTKLPYLDAVCKEALRLWPAVAYTERVASDDDILPLRFPVPTSDGQTVNSIKIKKGQNFFISTAAVNRDRAVWGGDSERFIPERWLDPSRLPPPDKGMSGFVGTATFIEGPRMCIGYRLAIFEQKVMIAALVKHFNLSETDDTVESRVVVTSQPYVAGQRQAGRQLPLRVRLADAD